MDQNLSWWTWFNLTSPRLSFTTVSLCSVSKILPVHTLIHSYFYNLESYNLMVAHFGTILFYDLFFFKTLGAFTFLFVAGFCMFCTILFIRLIFSLIVTKDGPLTFLFKWLWFSLMISLFYFIYILRVSFRLSLF